MNKLVKWFKKFVIMRMLVGICPALLAEQILENTKRAGLIRTIREATRRRTIYVISFRKLCAH